MSWTGRAHGTPTRCELQLVAPAWQLHADLPVLCESRWQPLLLAVSKTHRAERIRPISDPAASHASRLRVALRSVLLMAQPVRQLDHHLPVPAVPAAEQPQCQHEVHHQPRRQQPAPLLPRPGIRHHRVHQLRRENPGQHPDRDPVRQPAVRRQPLRTIMRHKTATIPRQALKQGHWGGRPSYGFDSETAARVIVARENAAG